MKRLFPLAIVLLTASFAFAELDTTTYVSHDGGGSGSVIDNGGGSYTLLDSDGGDMWNSGDQFIYLHDGDQVSESFTATVRVVSQTEAIDGRWGKAGLRASADLTGFSQFAMAQVATGNGSQPGGANPVPSRLGGRDERHPDGDGGFENPILDADGNELPNNTFAPEGTNMTWLSLMYDADTNGFTAGLAADVDGAPGDWSYSAPVTNVRADGDGWYVGLAYSAHDDLNYDQVTREDGFHGVTYDNYSFTTSGPVVPEPASFGLCLIGLMGMLGLRRRNR